MVRLQVCIKEICLSNIKSNVANNRNELSKYCRLCDSCDIGYRAQFNAEFPLQVMNFPVEYSTVRGQLTSSTLSRYILL